MKKLNELYDVDDETIIKGIKINSKEVSEGDLFICTKGVTADRHDFIDNAIENGASAIVVSKDGIKKDVPVIKVLDTNLELPKLCARFYDHPENKMTMIGVTGTDGKTSVTTIIQTLLGKDKCGYIGTNGYSCHLFLKDTNNTTPDADKLYGYLNEFVEAGCKYTAMETSSEAFYRGRLQNMTYDVSVITNITKEHLNIHGSFENYIECKCKLFEQTKKDGFSILNKDDSLYQVVRDKCVANVLTYGKDDSNDLVIKDFKALPTHTDITFVYQNKVYDVTSPMLGDFNVYNLAAALLACLSQGYKMEDLIPNIPFIKVSGRLEMLKTDDSYYVMVDYAHTPNGIDRLLNFVKSLDINKSIVVIGVAGERDKTKRPIMGEVVVNNASYAIFTYEDPRSEDPVDIINDLTKTIKDTNTNYEVVVDRKAAITRAINLAKDKDMVLILGKGNENYQKLKNETIHFNDIEEAYEAIAKRKEALIKN